MNLYNKTEKFVLDAFERAGKPTDVHHARRTVYWVKFLKPDADEALLVAAVAHDIERAFHGDWKKGSHDPTDLRKHQNLSAEEIEKFLKSESADEAFIKHVKDLVSHHEVGGDEEQNILSDADCLAYFEEKAMRHVKKRKSEGGSLDDMKKMLDHNFKKIHSKRAERTARKWYEEAVKELFAKG